MTDAAVPARKPAPARLMRTLAIAAAALLAVVLIGAAAGALFGFGAAPVPAPRNPFGVGLREGGTAGNGLVAWIFDVQSAFSRAMTGALRALKTEGGAAWSLVALAFAYGVFHAAGPGHGKAVVASYVLASERALMRGLRISFAAAMLQATVAVALVSVLALIFAATARTMTQVAGWIETASFAAVAAVGAVLLWRKAGSLGDLVAARKDAAALAHAHDHGHAHHHHAHDHAHHHHHHHHDHGHAADCGCGHSHAPVVAENAPLREAAGAVLAAGLRPCSGAIVVLVFALSQGLYVWGVVAAFAMGLGVAITTGALASLAVLAKAGARRLAGGEESPRAILAVRSLETAAAAAVLALGASLLLGSAAA